MQSDTRDPLFKTATIVARPALARWLWDRGIDWRQAGEAFDAHPETVRCWCLPFTDDDYRVPRNRSLSRIHEETGGAIGPADFYPPALNGPSADGGAQQDRSAG